MHGNLWKYKHFSNENKKLNFQVSFFFKNKSNSKKEELHNGEQNQLSLQQ